MRYEQEDLFIFVVDTEQYAGNFEREMTAYCTGIIGECEKGKEHAALFKEECPDFTKLMYNIVAQVPDEHGCHRPTSIYPTPGFWNDGMGNEYPDLEHGKQHTIDKYRETIREYQMTSGGMKDKDADTAMPGKHSSYQSVAMFFHERPSIETLGFLMTRAKKFTEVWKNYKFGCEIKIIGFRLVQEEVVTKELWKS